MLILAVGLEEPAESYAKDILPKILQNVSLGNSFNYFCETLKITISMDEWDSTVVPIQKSR
jgi:hypothetical protein